VVGPWLCRVVEVIVIWTVPTQGYGKLLDASVHTHDLHRPWVQANPQPNIKLFLPQYDAGSLFILLNSFHVYKLFLKRPTGTSYSQATMAGNTSIREASLWNANTSSLKP